MPSAPLVPRVVVFVDGQNLFHAVKNAFGYTIPNYDVRLLANAVCAINGWTSPAIRFYTGMPDQRDNQRWHRFWTAKLLHMSRAGVFTYSRSLRYRNQRIQLADGSEHTFLAAEEKGIDVRIAIDIIRLALRREYDIALIFSQDQDLSEVAEEIRLIAAEQGRWIKIACAFPSSPTSRNRGINKTDWIAFDRALYEKCIDNRDHHA